MARNVFSVPIFFIVFRETLEAAIIISVLLGLVEQIVHQDPSLITPSASAPAPVEDPEKRSGVDSASGSSEEPQVDTRALLRKMRIYIFSGAFLGLFLALAIGAAFIAVWFTQASNLWAKSEELWEGIFELVAAVIIFFMGLGMLKMDRAKAKWRVKLQRAFAGHADRKARTGKYVLFVLPLITVLREGMEAVIFVGGVSLGQPATSIPIAAIVGIVCGLVCGYLIYTFASRTTLTIFLVVMTNFLILIGAGLFSKAVWAFQENAFNHLLGADVDDAGGDGPGSFDVRGSVWHLDCCNPDNNFDNDGWTIFGAIFGWTNSATVGSVLAYVFYWLAVIAALVYMKFSEGRTKLFGRESALGRQRRERREATEAAVAVAEKE
ncbi:iron permease FTR1 [Epithele typhae]|uniref:iron permease FTR1 n=1 Tax=Epithele typhae TaxID=378194 RepID=UPI002008E88D|nr:iron permease FTR1 [Epithele typhae]KAH9941127.1 iron permease FTR1 [Epithele typhae]